MEENKEIVTLDSELIKLSYSGLSTYSNCPHAYNLKYNKKIRYNKPGIALIFGRAVHLLIQEWLDVIYTKSEKEGLKIKFKDRFWELIKNELAEEKEKYGDLNLYFTKELITDYYTKYLDVLYFLRKKRSSYFKLKSMELVGIETEIDYEYEYNNKKIKFTGFIDIILKNKTTGVYYILDLKTSKSGWRDYEKKDELKKSQLLLYKYFYSKQFDVEIDLIKVYFLILKREPYVSPDFPTKYIQEFEPSQGNVSINKSLKHINGFIENVLSDNPYYPKNKDGCKFCDYDSTEHCTKQNRISLEQIQKEFIIRNNKKVKVK
jgi:hypothetical protein